MAVRLRGLQEGDVTPLERILKANAPVFNETEVRAAVDMLLGGVGGPATTDGYRFIVAETDDGKVAGYALFAHTPLTVGTWDLYWIAADPAAHGRGVGPKLLRAVEEVVKNEGGRLVVIETSSRPDYKEGDHKVVYTRRIDKGESRRLNVPNLAQEPKSATP
jgi:GNAT superfamily N-acetyltransferase